MSEFDALRRRVELDPADLDAALRLSSALIRRGALTEAAPLVRRALRAQTDAQSPARAALLARLPSLPASPPSSWRRLATWPLPSEATLTALCIDEPRAMAPTEALEARPEVRVDLILDDALYTADLASGEGLEALTRSPRLSGASGLRSQPIHGLLSTLTPGGEASLWSRRGGAPIRGLSRISSARFARRRGETVWLLGERSGAVRRVELSPTGSGFEAWDRQPWRPHDAPAGPIWDLALDPESGAVTLLDARGVRRYRALGQSERLEPRAPLSTGAAHARLSSDGRRAITLTSERAARAHRVRIVDLTGEASGDVAVELGMWVERWRSDAGCGRGAFRGDGRVELRDLRGGDRLASWSAPEGLLEVWPDGHDRVAWWVFEDRLELHG